MENWQEKFVARATGKPDQHHYITDMDSMKPHEELYQTPHLRSLYSMSFRDAENAAKVFCHDITSLTHYAPKP